MDNDVLKELLTKIISKIDDGDFDSIWYFAIQNNLSHNYIEDIQKFIATSSFVKINKKIFIEEFKEKFSTDNEKMISIFYALVRDNYFPSFCEEIIKEIKIIN